MSVAEERAQGAPVCPTSGVPGVNPGPRDRALSPRQLSLAQRVAQRWGHGAEPAGGGSDCIVTEAGPMAVPQFPLVGMSAGPMLVQAHIRGCQ